MIDPRYLAAFVDADGSISAGKRVRADHQRGYYHRVVVAIGQKRSTEVDRLMQDIVDEYGGSLYRYERKPKPGLMQSLIKWRLNRDEWLLPTGI